MAEPTATDFDFEAHMAKLLNKSAASLGLDGKSINAGKHRGKLSALLEEDEDGEYFDEDDISWPSDEEVEYDEDDHQHQRRHHSHHISEEQFDQILQEYEVDEDYDDNDDEREYDYDLGDIDITQTKM